MIRINKALADKGLCSRREADEWIANGWVFLNGERVKAPGIKIDPERDVLTLDKPETAKRYYLLYKPRGYLSTVVENEGLSLLRLLPVSRGLFPIGRLDKDSEGIILVTDDRTLPVHIIGEMSHIEKEYEVVLAKALDADMVSQVERGLVLSGKQLKPCTIKVLSPTTCSICITEGRNRQVRGLFERIGNYVIALKRTRIGDLHIGDMKPGEFRVLTRESIML